MPCIIINDKYTEAILWSAHILAYMHIYTWKQAGSQLYSHTSASTETMAVVHTGPVNGPFHQSALQQDTNWAKKGKKNTQQTKSGKCSGWVFPPKKVLLMWYFSLQENISREEWPRTEEHAALHSCHFPMGDFEGVRSPWWYKHGQAIPRTSRVRLQGLESRCII